MSKTKIDLIDISIAGVSEDSTHDVPVSFNDDGEAIAGFKVVDANSKRYRDAKRAFDVQAVKAATVRRKAIDGKTDEGATALLNIGETQKLALIKACVVGLYGFGSGGKPVEPTDEVLTSIFARWPTLIDKVAEKINEASSFLTMPATS